jgi:hypothetical protein
MDWISPYTALVAGAVAVPALVLLYFLKLKRRQVPVSSTLLWKRAVQDLQVNAPLRLPRKNILLLLQLLALLALLVALGRPVLSLDTSPPRRVVLLIDQSASMRATDVAPTRLAEAKRQAREVVESLRAGSGWFAGSRSDEAMVIAFAGTSRVLCNYTADKVQLAAAIDSIEETDGETLLSDAVAVARAYATPAGTEDKNRSAETPARLELFSDGRIADLDRVIVAPGELNFHAIGRTADNVAIVALQARRSFENPEALSVFVDVANYGAEAVACEVQLAIDGNVRSVEAVTVLPRSAGKPGHTVVSFVLSHAGAGVLEARVLRPDALAADNNAWAVLAPAKALAVLLVTEGNPALRSALKSCAPARLDAIKPAEFDRIYAAQGALELSYDLVVLDRHDAVPPLSGGPSAGRAPDRLPRGNYLVFGRPPAASGARAEGELKDQWIVDWRSRHPVLNFVNLDNVLVARANRLVLPRDATVLAEFGDSPAIAEVRRQGGVMILVGFDVLQSSWPFDAGFVMFCCNVVNYIGREAAEGQAPGLKVGQPLSVRGAPGVRQATVTTPDGAAVRVEGSPSGAVRYAATSRAGVYRLAVEGGADHLFAVNLLDAAESDIGAAHELVFSGQKVKAEEGGPARANQEIWPLLALLGLLVVYVEWYVYNAKVRL